MYAREEIAKREQASMECAPQDGHDPVVTVQVLGERLPEVSPKDELQVGWLFEGSGRKGRGQVGGAKR